MIRINLGKEEEKKKSPWLQWLEKAGGSKYGDRLVKLASDVPMMATLVVSTVVSFLPHIFFVQFRAFFIAEHNRNLLTMESSIAAITKEIDKFKPFKMELESYERQKKIVQERLEVVRKLLSNRGKPVNVLDALSQSLPARTWVNSIDFSMTATPATIKLSGQSYNNEDISDFIDRLGESIYFSDVRLEGVTSSRLDRIDVRSFNITATPKGEFGPPKRSAAAAPQPVPAKQATVPPPSDIPPGTTK